MKTTNEQLLRDPDIQPSGDVIGKALGEANNTYVKLTDKLADHNVHLEWLYYSDGKAWLAKGLYFWKGARGGQKETTVFWLSVWNGFFKVTVFVPEKFRSDALNLPLDDVVKQMIAASEQMGKLKFSPIVFELCSDEMLNAVFTLIDFKKSIK
jgi:hypothetical protein